ncbi:MAG: hypothetical protein H0W43_10880 [Chthoniobacterales bacterium]|nr:hypothetical protein [Chthoniobacterales bacterium]
MLWLVALWALVAVAAVVETLLFDLVALMRAGAYGFVMASNSNSRPPPAEVLVRGTGFGLIRERQGFAISSEASATRRFDLSCLETGKFGPQCLRGLPFRA